MYEFNPLTSMEVLQNLRPDRAPRPTDLDRDQHDTTEPAFRLTEFVRRVIRRISARRDAA
jgi:hypothetical protein